MSYTSLNHFMILIYTLDTTYLRLYPNFDECACDGKYVTYD